MRRTEIVSASPSTLVASALVLEGPEAGFRGAKFQMHIINLTLFRLAADDDHEAVVTATRD